MKPSCRASRRYTGEPVASTLRHHPTPRRPTACLQVQEPVFSYSTLRLNCRRMGLVATFALWWYMELLPEKQLCENSNAFFRAVPRDFRTGDPTFDSDVVTCEGYMAYGTDLFGQVYNRTLCADNFTLIEHK